MKDMETREWWTHDKIATAIDRVLKRAREADASRERAIRDDLGLYVGRRIDSLDAYAYGLRRDRDQANDPRLPLAKSITDTVHSKLAKDIPRAFPLVENGTWTLQKQAEALEAFIEGVKERNDWRRLYPLAVRDAQVLRAGCAKVHSRTYKDGDAEWGRILIDRVFPWELRVDPIEATYGKPRSIFYECPVDRRVAMATWPKLASVIRSAKRVDMGASYHSHADQVRIVEAYHLPSAPGEDDGIRVVTVDGAQGDGTEAVTTPWTRDHFPFSVFSWAAPFMGYWGHGLVEDIAGLHITLNEVDEVIRNRMRQSVGFIFTSMPEIELELDNSADIPIFKVAKGMDLNESSFQYISPSVVNPELLNERESLTQKGYQMAGVTQLSATGLKPSGLDAAVALREYQDIESERFATPQLLAEQFVLEVSKLIVREAQDLAERDIDVEVPAKRQRMRKSVLKKMRWSELRLDEGAYELTIAPASAFPRTPAGRLAMVEQLIAAGFLDRTSALKLLKIPDVEDAMAEQLAPYYIVMDAIEIMLEEKRRITPIPEMDLDLAFRVTNLAILQAEMDEVPDDRIALLRGFAGQVEQLQSAAEQQMAAEQAAAQGAMMPNPASALQAGMAQGALPQGQAAPVEAA